MRCLFARGAVLLVALLAGCGGGDGGTEALPPELQLSVQPGTLVAHHGESVVVRVDMPSVADADLPSGYAIDLDEVAASIDVATAPCPPGAGSRMCQDWTVTPRAGAVPGDYGVNVRSVGSRAGTAAGSFRLVVVADPAPAYGAAVRIAFKTRHLLVINDAGRVFARGDNTSAQVRFAYQRLAFPGDAEHGVLEPHRVDEFVETRLPPGRWVGVSTSADGSFAVRDDGTVWAWGYNGDNDLGLTAGASGERFVAVPRQIAGLANVRAVSADYENAKLIPIVLFADGRVRRWFGLRTPLAYCEVVPAEVNATECEREFAGVQAVAGAGQNAVFLKQDGSVWRAPHRPCIAGECPPDRDGFSSGLGRVERLTGVLPPAVAVASALATGIALAADGTVWQWQREGAPDSAVQVAGLTEVTAIAGSYPGFETFALKRDGSVWVWDARRGQVPRPVAGLANVVAIADGHAITGDCGSAGGAVWRIRAGTAIAERLSGFGAGSAGCTNAPTRTVTVSVEGTGRVVSSPAGIDCPGACSAPFAAGSRVTLNDAPGVGWTTELRSATTEESQGGVYGDQPAWRGDAACAHAIVVAADTSCALRFVPGGDRRLLVNVTGAGRVTSLPQGIDCGADCVQSYAVATAVTLRATPALGYRFGDFAGDGDCADAQLAMDAVKNCIARFVALPPPAAPTGFAATGGANGVTLRWDAVNGPVVRYRLERADASGAVVTLDDALDGTASGFADGGALPNTAYTYRLTAINASGESAAALASVITLPPTRAQLTVSVAGSGSVASTPAGIDCTAGGGACSASFALNTQVQLAATPGAGYRLAAFGGAADCADGVVTLGSSLACSVTFEQVNGLGWVQLGGGPLTVSGVAPLVSLAIGTGNVPHAAFLEAVPAGDVARLRVQRFDGAAWQPLGDALNAGAITPASDPSLAFAPDGVLHLAWSQGNGVQQDIFVARYGGVAWEAVGTGGVPLNYAAGSRASGPALGFDSAGLPLVAWIEDGAVKFKRWTGVAWVPAAGAGTAEGPASAGADRVRLATYADGVPVLAWTEGAGIARALRVVRDFSFAPLGTQVNAPGTLGLTQFGVLADRNGPLVPGPTVTWAQGVAPFSILARRWDGAAWIDNASPIVNADPGGLLSFAMARNAAAVVHSAAVSADLVALRVNLRFNLVSWDPVGPSLETAANAGLRGLALEMTGDGRPVVAGIRLNASERFELHVFGYFP